jgi:hypothetical protein
VGRGGGRGDDGGVVAGVVGGEELREHVGALAAVVEGHVLEEAVVVVYLVEEDEVGAAGRLGHPRPLPRLDPLHLRRHLRLRRQRHAALERRGEPLGLDGVGGDVGDGGHLAPHEGQIRHLGGEHVPVEVEAVGLHVEGRHAVCAQRKQDERMKEKGGGGWGPGRSRRSP